MVDLVIEHLKKARTRGRKRPAVREKHLRDSGGRSVRVLALDANSATFSDDLTAVFERNVARARRENKKLLGHPGGLPPGKE
jgi:hypothetical protein